MKEVPARCCEGRPVPPKPGKLGRCQPVELTPCGQPCRLKRRSKHRSGPVLLGLPLNRRRCRVLALEPVR
jgi:hypothetical protein